jgi:hypothetical protein
MARHRAALAAGALVGILLVAAGAAPAAAESEGGGAETAGAGSSEGAPSNNNFASAANLVVQDGFAVGNTSEATVEPGEPFHRASASDARQSVWFNWTATSTRWVAFGVNADGWDSVVAVYTGATLGTLTPVAKNDDDPYRDTLDSRVFFHAQSGTTYRVAVDGFGTGDAGPFELTFGAPDAADNNHFAGGEVLTGPSGGTSGYNISATADPGQPTTSGVLGTNSIWHEWVAPASGPFFFSTDPDGPDTSNFDTLLAAYTGSAVNALSLVTANDDITPGVNHRSAITLNATQGTTYRIAVSGYEGISTGGGPVGLVELEWDYGAIDLPENDDFADAQVITGVNAATIGGNVEATTETGEPSHHYGSEASVWYAWTAPDTGPVTFDATGTIFESAVAVYTGAVLNDLTLVRRSFAWTSDVNRVRFNATAGTTYRVAVDTFDEVGLINLAWFATDPSFTDVPINSQFFREIEWMNDNEITTGFPGGVFKPSQAVNRAAMAAFMYRFDDYDPEDFEPPATPTFSDVGPSHPFFEEIESLADHNILGGFPDGTFRPGAAVSRQAMSAFMYRLDGEPTFTAPVTPSFSDVPTTSTFYEEIEWMNAEEITTGFPGGVFKPSAPVSRQAMSAFMQRLADYQLLD